MVNITTEARINATPLARIMLRVTDGDFSQIMNADAARSSAAAGTAAIPHSITLSITASIIGRQAIMHATP